MMVMLTLRSREYLFLANSVTGKHHVMTLGVYGLVANALHFVCVLTSQLT